MRNGWRDTLMNGCMDGVRDEEWMEGYIDEWLYGWREG